MDEHQAEPSTSSLWHYSVAGSSQGPVPFFELKEMLANGQLEPSCFVWTEGMAEWAPAHDIAAFGLRHDLEPEREAATDPSELSGPQHEYAGAGTVPNASLPIKIDPSFCIGQGWNALRADFWNLFKFGLIVLLLYILFEMPSDLIKWQMDQQGLEQIGLLLPISYLASVFFSRIAQLILHMGILSYGLQLVDGQKPKISTLLSQWPKFLPALAASFLSTIAVLFGLLLLIIPGIILAVRLQFALVAILEHNMGPIEALKYSWNLTRENTLNLFVLQALSSLLLFAGMLCLILGVAAAIPVFLIAYLTAYRTLQGKQDELLMH